MASRRSHHQKAEVAALIHSLYGEGRYGTWVEFAEDAHVHAVALSDWKNGKVMPDGYNLLKLIKAASARAREEPIRQSLRLVAAQDAHDGHDGQAIELRLRSLEAAVAQLPTAPDLKRGLESLRRTIARASRDSGAAPPASRKG